MGSGEAIQATMNHPAGGRHGGASSVADMSRRGDPAATAGKILGAAAGLWFVVAVLGQLLMAAYVIGFYGRAAVTGDFERWNRVLHNGYIAGDGFGNLVLLLHLLFAVVIVMAGALQLVPAVRRRWPVFHHWNGRLYLTSAAVLSLGGLYLVWTRDSLGSLNDIAISLNALLILAFAVLALRAAMARRIAQHRRWALRLFLAVSGVWFFRVGLMFWLLVNQGPVGFDPQTFQGPFLVFLVFAQYLLPLAVLELYFRARDGGRTQGRFAMAAGLGLLTLAMATGIVAASLMMWLPMIG